MTIKLPELCLIVLVGPSGSGKSTFARQHFGPFEVLSSDFCRGLVSDDENDQRVSGEAFELLHTILHQRLKLGRLTVVDATNVRPEDRRMLVQIAREHHVLPVAVVFDLPEKLCQERNRQRDDRTFGPHVIRNQRTTMRRNLRGLKREGFRHIFTFKAAEDVDAAIIERQPLWNDRRDERGPFDIIGDVHGCFDELRELLDQLGYRIEDDATRDDGLGYRVTPPAGRKAIFLGDLVDRGPNNPGVLRLVMSMVHGGTAICVPGNHDDKLKRKLAGRDVKLAHGLAETLAQLDAEPEAFGKQVREFIDSLISHYVLDDGRLVVAHAGLKEAMQGRASGKVREFCLYGETTGETDAFGLPVRHNWAAEYRGQAMVVYGHTPVPEPEWLNQTTNIDTGCAFGGRLTALRYPERELISVPAKQTYAEPARPFLPEPEAEETSAQQQVDNVLDLADVFGKRIIDTRLTPAITIREQHSAAALEVMSRFAADPRWLIHLPPTMSPCETSQREGYLEHPDEAFAYYRNHAVPRVICQQKHMGSRAIVIVCRDATAAKSRFGVSDGSEGIIYTRTGRPFFNDPEMEQAVLHRVGQAVDGAALWDELQTEWLCLDCEVMPWSAKAQELLRSQYAAVGSAGQHAFAETVQMLAHAARRTTEVTPLLDRYRARSENVVKYADAYRQYCWQVDSPDDLRLAPFHLLASEGKVHTDRDHAWHMSLAQRLAQADGQVLMSTDHRVVDLTNQASVDEAIGWWTSLTGRGGEGMVVKPMDFIVRHRGRLVQPAMKCRGREYLRIIYGPDYTEPEHLIRLRSRRLGRKRGLALPEFALGLEALERFVQRAPLRRVHECTFGVLALESEPVAPRL
ncbi:MAG: polynucleotide kinase-phosphatase [Phycisphaeraceae bacterium]